MLHVGKCKGQRQVNDLDLHSHDLDPILSDRNPMNNEVNENGERDVYDGPQNGDAKNHKSRCAHCNYEWDPICSETGVTYNNKCWAICRYLEQPY